MKPKSKTTKLRKPRRLTAGVVEQLRQAIRRAEARGLNRNRIAKISGLPTAIVYHLMSGQRVPGLANAEKIARAVGCDLIIIDRQ